MIGPGSAPGPTAGVRGGILGKGRTVRGLEILFAGILILLGGLGLLRGSRAAARTVGMGPLRGWRSWG